MKKIGKLLIAALATITMVTGTVGCSMKEDSVVAVVDGVKIPESLYNTYLWSTGQFFEQIAGPSIWDMELEGKKSEDVAKERALESVVLSVVTTNKAAELGIELTKEEKKQTKEDAKNFIKSQEELAKAHGFGEKDVEELLLASQLSTKVQEKIGENYVPNEEEVQKYIEESINYYEKVTARHILIKTIDDNRQPLPEDTQKEKLALAEELLARVKQGEDIGTLATKYSEDEGSADKNGEYTFGRGEMVVEFEKAAFDGQDGQVWPELVKSEYGYHIIQTIAHIPADKDQIRQNYIKGAKADFANAEFEELIANAKIEKTELYDEIKVVRTAETDTEETSESTNQETQSEASTSTDTNNE